MADDPQEKFYKLLQGFRIGMLVTRTASGALHARPMSLAEKQGDGDVWFSTEINSPKVADIQNDPTVNVTLQSDNVFLTISGHATVVRDRAKIEELWSEAWKVWFPAGKDDPTLALLRVEAHEGEYWDNSGAEGLKFLLKAATAYVKGEKEDSGGSDDEDINAKVQLD